ncbi:MAG: hypothetical protein ACRDFA_12690 [bacterium]
MRYLLVAVVLIGTMLAAGLAEAAAPAPVPFKPGSSWTYRVHTKPAQGVAKAEMRTITYKGEMKVRGRAYHAFEIRTGMATLERELMVWTGTAFRRAIVMRIDGAKTMETVYDKPYATSGVAENLAGRTQDYVEGEATGRGAWSNSVSRSSDVKVTTPAGAFTTTRWEGTYILGNVKQIYTIYTVGPLQVRADYDIFVKGQYQSTVVHELQKGPVPK